VPSAAQDTLHTRVWADRKFSCARSLLRSPRRRHLRDCCLVGGRSAKPGPSLSRADLSGASLCQADLEGANLGGDQVTDEQFAQAEPLEGATLPNGAVHE
jgi:hypothetical protein